MITLQFLSLRVKVIAYTYHVAKSVAKPKKKKAHVSD